MDIQDPQFVEKILLEKISTVEAGLLSAYPGEALKGQFESGSCSTDDKVKACLSFHPGGAPAKESIDLVFAVACSPRGAIFSSEIAWSDGKVIDEVVVCEVCPECFDELGDRVDAVVGRVQDALIERMIDLMENFS